MVHSRYTADGELYSPMAIEFNINLENGMNIQSVWVHRLDEDLNTVDSVAARLGEFFRYNDYIGMDTLDFYSPYVKVVVSAVDDSAYQTNYEYYMDIVDEREPEFTLLKSLASKRVKRLFKDEGIALEEAIQSSYELIDSVVKSVALRTDAQVSPNPSFSIRLLSGSFEFGETFAKGMEKLRDAFAEGDSIPMEIQVQAIDEIFEKMGPGSANGGYYNSNYVFQPFVEKVCGIAFCSNDQDGLMDTVRQALSAYHNRPVVCEGATSIFSMYNTAYWRTLSEQELILGACTPGGSKIAIHEEKLYKCEKASREWVLSENAEETRREVTNDMVAKKYGACDNELDKRLRYVDTVLYMCQWERGVGYYWTPNPGVIKNQYPDTGWSTPAYEDASGAVELGNCDQDREGEKGLSGGGFYECGDDLWVAISRVEYYAGICDSTNEGSYAKIPLEDSSFIYQVCEDWEWVTANAWDYYGDECTAENAFTLVGHDSVYYLCRGKMGFLQLQKENLVPPTFDQKPCGDGLGNSRYVNTIIQYDDGSFYTCTDKGWILSEDSELPPPVKEGHFCTEENKGEGIKIGDSYFLCSDNHIWKSSSEQKYLQYVFMQEHAKDCDDGITGTTVVYSEAHQDLMGCVKYYNSDSLTYRGFQVTYGGAPKFFEGGKFVNDSIYRVTVGDLVYEFRTEANGYWKYVLFPQKVYEGSISDENYKYDPYTIQDEVFLHGRRGDDEVLLSDIPNKSESFDAFYEAWVERLPKDHIDQGRLMVEATTDSVKAIWYNENSFMDYATAKNFCPEGYHIPDTLEWAHSAAFEVKSRLKDYRNDSPIVEWSSNKKIVYNFRSAFVHYYDIFWTSTEKDENTQYCYEYLWDNFEKNMARRFIECPKDLYPMVQTECVKD